MNSIESNKRIVTRFNKEVIEQGNFETFQAIMHKDFVNETAPPIVSNQAEGMWDMLSNVLRPAFPDLRVDIYDQVGEGKKVTTRKALLGTHKGTIMGVPPTNKEVKIEVIDIVEIRDGKYFRHWGINTMGAVIAGLKG